MTTTQPPSQPAAASHTTQTSPQAASSTNGAPAATSSESSQPGISFPGMASEQVLAILKGLGPNFYSSATAAASRPGVDPKDSAMAAEALSNMSQAGFAHALPNYQHYNPLPTMESGPSSHPRGPPNLAGVPLPTGAPSASASRPDDGQGDDGHLSDDGGQPTDSDKPKSAGGRRNGRSASMSNDEWARQRKDNHKEVERRRRGNINEGINELGRIVPNGSGEKAKGAILSRAVQYIHHLKENEARNIEKWTLEKLLMDQAMGDLQAQLDEMRRLWEDERSTRQRLEGQLEALKAGRSASAGANASSSADTSTSPSGNGPDNKPSSKRTADEGRQSPAQDGEERQKRQRVE